MENTTVRYPGRTAPVSVSDFVDDAVYAAARLAADIDRKQGTEWCACGWHYTDGTACKLA